MNHTKIHNFHNDNYIDIFHSYWLYNTMNKNYNFHSFHSRHTYYIKYNFYNFHTNYNDDFLLLLKNKGPKSAM